MLHIIKTRPKERGFALTSMQEIVCMDLAASFDHRCGICGKLGHGTFRCRWAGLDNNSYGGNHRHDKFHKGGKKPPQGDGANHRRDFNENGGGNCWKAVNKYLQESSRYCHSMLPLNNILDRKPEAQEIEKLVSRFENLDLDSIVTPVDANRLKELLEVTNYDVAETAFLVTGFQQGFDMGYRGPENRQDKASNIPLRIGDKWELWEKVMKEVSLKRYCGPF